ncbi:MAG TPA: hypothetical protein VMI92_06585 [Steroidobacteraceae bacterium]|nr:hypothetical protein [Steroidobacteraceae bacterium]
MSRKILTVACALSAGLLVSTAYGMDASAQRYAQMLASGGVSSMQRAAEEIFNQSLTDQELLDVTAETLAEKFTTNTGETFVDTMAWLCKALGNSGNGRYKALLTDIGGKATQRKEKGYCKKGADNLPKGVAPYVVGSINLDNYKEGGSAYAGGGAAKPAAAAPAAPARAPGAKADFSLVKEGMSMEEVYSTIGEPTATTSRMTGKAFRPFNFSGKDNVRQTALYKGVGRIVFSNSSAYTSTYRVIEIVPDPTETGFP